MEHTFYGTWEIVSCTFDGKREASGLEGIKFRLDDTSDITWYNDLISPLPESKDCNVCCYSESVLFSCETFDVHEDNPRLVFGAIAGHCIEFNTTSLKPTDTLYLECDGWYVLECKRLKNDQAVGQEKEFSYEEAFNECYFSDVVIKSSEGLEYHVHSPILRLNGFDCSMCRTSPKSPIENDDAVKIHITIPTNECDFNAHKNLPNLNLSPIYLQPPDMASLSVHKTNHLSSSFNCLTSGNNPIDHFHSQHLQKKYSTSSSDSNLQTSRNIFNFSNDLFLQPMDTICNVRKPPLSPYRARSPSPFPNQSSIETPPSSPLTPVGVLNNLPSFMLTPILNWLYTESLMPIIEEDACEKLINFAETQPTLMRMVEPCRKYLKLIRLKKFVVNVIADMHSILNRVIQAINPATIPHEPHALFSTFKDSLRDGAIACAKVLQLCNIFLKEAAGLTRNQKNEIIKYVKARIPIFMSQIHQLLKNILLVFSNLTNSEKVDLITYLVPEIELTLVILTNVIEEIKNSLNKMCKDLKCSHLNNSSMKKDDEEKMLYNVQLSKEQNYHIFSTIHRPSAMYDISASVKSDKRLVDTENDLKFVIYMYEVRKMRDIYGRISLALDIIRDKKIAFCSMNLASKKSTIHQNLEQLILDIPTYITFIENLSDRLDEKIGWKEFKFCFKLATSQINGVIVKVLDHKAALKDPLTHLCKLVQREEFTNSLIELGLIEPSNILQDDGINSGWGTFKRFGVDYKNVKQLNLIKSLCEPPIAANSNLSKNALRLLHSCLLTDMEFEIHVFSNNQNSMLDIPNQVHSFRAHRVIVSARCEWFKKALLSGMQESINRKIIITDTTPVIFRRLLLYLYGAPIDKTVGAEQICELMLLADRYSIEDLKDLCETTLNNLIDEESVLCLLGIADRYMTSSLKSNCLTFISQHPKLTKLELFSELPQVLQREVEDLICWYGRVPEPWNDFGFKPRSSSRHSLKSPSKPRSRSRKSSPSCV